MNKIRKRLLIATQLCLTILSTIFIAAPAQAQSPVAANNRSQSTRGLALTPHFRFTLMPAGFRLMPASSTSSNAGPRSSTISLMPAAATANLQVLGGGTVGRLAKWTGFTSSNSFIGDSTIFEDKFGNVGIGTDTPTAKLTVAGTIIASGGVSIIHDATLRGNGTTASPLGVAVPLILSGAVPRDSFDGVIRLINTASGGNALTAFAGGSGTGDGGNGVSAFGGFTNDGFGGGGLAGLGGDANSGIGGQGVFAQGGNSDSNTAGEGVDARGGFSSTGAGGAGVTAFAGGGKTGGIGVIANGGSGDNSGVRGAGVFATGGVSGFPGFGGAGVFATGGTGRGAGHSGGIGIVATGGTATDGATPGLAGKFIGDVQIIGNTFTISAGKGLILKSPDGATCRLVSIDNAGNLVLTAIACP